MTPNNARELLRELVDADDTADIRRHVAAMAKARAFLAAEPQPLSKDEQAMMQRALFRSARKIEPQQDNDATPAVQGRQSFPDSKRAAGCSVAHQQDNDAGAPPSGSSFGQAESRVGGSSASPIQQDVAALIERLRDWANPNLLNVAPLEDEEVLKAADMLERLSAGRHE